MNNLKLSKKQVLISVFLLLGIAISVYLMQQTQVFKSKADLDVSSTLDISGDRDDPDCSGDSCTTESDTVTIQLKADPNELFKP